MGHQLCKAGVGGEAALLVSAARIHRPMLVLRACLALLLAMTPVATANQKRRAPEGLCSKSGAFSGAEEPTSMTWGGNMIKVYHNLYYHNQKWYAVPQADNNMSEIDLGMSMNYNVIMLPATDAAAFQANLGKICYVPGVTLRIDFPFPGYPDNLGHWGEIMWPTFSVFNTPEWTAALQRPGGNGGGGGGGGSGGKDQGAGDGGGPFVSRVLLANLSSKMLDWFKEVLSIALGSVLPPGSEKGGLPPLMEEESMLDYSKLRWYVFEHVAVVQDRYPLMHNMGREKFLEATRGLPGPLFSSQLRTGFTSKEMAGRFREAAYARAGWPLARNHSGAAAPGGAAACGAGGGGLEAAGACAAGPEGGEEGWPPFDLPRVVTVMLDPDHYPPVTNHRELVEKLEDVAGRHGFKVRVTSLSMEAPFLSHLATMAETGLLVARHGPILSTSVLLPPGAAVLELLPYKWDWRNMSSLYFNMTRSTGVLHHYVWRPTESKWAKYTGAGERERYADWTGNECRHRDCLEVHARAGLEVDLEAIEQLLEKKLPGILRGDSVQELQEPWPKAW